MTGLEEKAKNARIASLKLQSASIEERNKALSMIQEILMSQKEAICQLNALDLEEALIQVQSGQLSESLMKRLDISKKFHDLIQGIHSVIQLPDPLGKVTLATQLDEGLELFRVSCPLGVILVIFEARPEVVIQISALAIKSGNAVILKGGKEARNSNEALVNVIRRALDTFPSGSAITPDCVQLVNTREEISELLKLEKYIDLVIPRGSNALVKHIQENTRIPVLGHADGICSVYVDETANIQKSIPIIIDSKTNYPAACNSTETLLIHASLLSNGWLDIANSLINANVTLKCDASSYNALPKALQNVIHTCTEKDYSTEFLDLTLAVKTVESLHDAIDHINHYGSHHTDVILTESKNAADAFMTRVDSAGVYWNASSRFADGFRYGFGAEIGVSTNKTHARGPVGLEGLVIYKYKLIGKDHCIAMYGEGKRSFIHKPL